MLSPEDITADINTCPVCQASFTRKTHLTRHLHSHLNHRTYSCDHCGRATFTRSDLLTRHAKRCAQNPGGIPLSRKKACQACVKRKVRCDLQLPCAKCAARGDECVYQGHQATPAENGVKPSSDAVAIASSNMLPQDHGAQSLEDRIVSPLDPLLMNRPPDSVGTSSYEPTSAPSAIVLAPHSSVGAPFQTMNSMLSGSYWSSDIFPPINPAVFQPDDSLDMNDFSSLLPNASFYSYADYALPEVAPQIPRPLALPALEPVAEPGLPDTDDYLSHFFSVHCRQYPFYHLPTWSHSTEHPLMVHVMRASGALHLLGKSPKGRAADTFVLEVLQGDLRQSIFRAFIQTPRDNVDLQTQLILAMISMQNLGLFHRFPAERSVSAAYHGMLLTMVRKSALPAFVQDWQVPSLETLDTHQAWKSWACYETVKRALTICYLHDTLMSVFHNLPSLCYEDELLLRHTCDDELWNAPDPQRWAQLVGPNPAARLRGELLNATVFSMYIPTSTAEIAPMNRFASFTVLHSLLRSIYQSHRLNGNDYERRFAIQHALTQWYINRLASASLNGASYVGHTAHMDFTCTALPLYWLAQLWHAELSEGTVMRPGITRFNAMKRWLKDFWSALRDAGEVGVGMRFAGVPDTSTGFAFLEGLDEAHDLDKTDAGLLEWVPPR